MQEWWHSKKSFKTVIIYIFSNFAQINFDGLQTLKWKWFFQVQSKKVHKCNSLCLLRAQPTKVSRHECTTLHVQLCSLSSTWLQFLLYHLITKHVKTLYILIFQNGPNGLQVQHEKPFLRGKWMQLYAHNEPSVALMGTSSMWSIQNENSSLEWRHVGPIWWYVAESLPLLFWY